MASATGYAAAHSAAYPVARRVSDAEAVLDIVHHGA